MSLEIVILAAGQGTRMRSALPKVLHPIAGNSMLGHVIHSARQLDPQRIHVVIGHGADAVRERLAADDLNFVLQDKQLGTGHAVAQAVPFIQSDTVQRAADLDEASAQEAVKAAEKALHERGAEFDYGSAAARLAEAAAQLRTVQQIRKKFGH